jgi:CubicO group peptidase (beta-lactamase class C family)
MSVAVVRQGKLVYAKGFGFADLENDVKAKPDTVYRIGSVTKQFTATMVMQLVQEGKLKLDDPMRKHLPDLPEAWDKVTIRHLLNHTSGIHNYTQLPKIMEEGVRTPTTPRGIVATVEAMPLDFEPGSKWNYSNTAYEILGLIVEKYDARPFGQSLQARIFGPLGMSNSHFASNGDVVKGRAQGYTEKEGKIRNADFIDMSWPYAAGSIESTVVDLAKWDAALYGDKVLPQAALKQMWTKTRLSTGNDFGYGFGWGLKEVNGYPIVEHNGGIHGFISNIRRAPGKGLTVVVLTNSDHSDADGVAERLMAFIDPDLKAKEPAALKDKDPATTQLARKTFESVLAGNLDRTKLGPELAKLLTPQFLEGAQKQLSASGPLKRFVLIASEDKDGKKHRTFGVTLGEAMLKFEFVVGPTGLIEAMGIHP